MGNGESRPTVDEANQRLSELLDRIPSCGTREDADSPRRSRDDASSTGKGLQKLFRQADGLCATSPDSAAGQDFAEFNDLVHNEFQELRRHRHGRNGPTAPPDMPVEADDANVHPASSLLARVLVSEVTDNPNAMTPAQMAERERKLLRAQQQAVKAARDGTTTSRPVGANAPVHLPNKFVTDPRGSSIADTSRKLHTVTIGLSLSRRHSVGHPRTVTRQTAFDFNELQDRAYKYVSSTDNTGWRAGGGEKGRANDDSTSTTGRRDESAIPPFRNNATVNAEEHVKKPSPDTVHIPIIDIETRSQHDIDAIVSALATGEIFIPHMSVLPEALSVNGTSPPDLVVRFGTERNDDLPPEDWPNWCLEFMHNQIYEYFQNVGAKWTERPFSITLAKKVRWKTVKHMNRYFSHAERVIDAWRERGPQYLDPQLAYIEGGATPEEVAKPHGIYLMRDGVPTNYFPPNFDPPYTTKMTRSLLLNVLDKSWDKKRREWTSTPAPRLVTPSVLLSTMCGCVDNNAGGFMANEVTVHHNVETSHIFEDSLITRTPRSSVVGVPDVKLNTPEIPDSGQFVSKQQQQQQQSNHYLSSNDRESNPQSQHSERALRLSTVRKPNDDPFNVSPAELNNGDLPVVSPAASREREADPVDRRSPFHDHATADVTVDRDDGTDTEENGHDFLDHNATHNSDYQDAGRRDSQDDLNTSSVSRDPAGDVEFVGDVADDSNDAEERHQQPLDAAEESVGLKVSPVALPKRGRYNERGQPDAPQQSDGVDSDAVKSGRRGRRRQAVARGRLDTGDDEGQRRWAHEEKKESSAPEVLGGKSTTLASDEDWLADKGSDDPEPKADNGTERSVNGKHRHDGTNGTERKSANGKAFAPQASSDSGPARTKKSSSPVQRSGLSVPSQEIVSHSSRKTSDPAQTAIVQRNSSGVSLEYSVDSSSMQGDASTAGGSTLLGQHIPTDASVSSKGSLQRRAAGSVSASAGGDSKEDDHTSSFSLQESTSSLEVVPTDEELFAVGWAKAMDPKSGSYYYFTLDRSKIVWENPLSVQSSGNSAGSI